MATNGGLLTADQILEADDLKTEYVDVPEWGGTVKVRAMNSSEVARWRRNAISRAVRRGNEEVEIDFAISQSDHELLFWCCIQEDNTPVFTSADQIARLAKKGHKPIERIATVIRDLSGLTEEGKQKIVGESKPEDQPAQSLS